MSDIIFHSQFPSAYLWTATMVATEKGVSWTRKDIEAGSATHLRLHPFAKSPVLQHGAVIVYETMAIAHYIDSVFDGPALQPEDPLGQADVLRWISLVNAYMFPTLSNELAKERLLVPSQGGVADEALIALATQKMKHQFEVMTRALRLHDFLVGNQVTLADCFLLPHVHFVSMTPEGKAALKEAKLVDQWLKRMRERPSFAASDQFAPKAA